MANSTNLTENDRKILVMAWQSFKTQPQVDYTKLATLGNYKTPASATACYLAARKKLLSTTSKPLTANDLKLITLAWQCFKSIPTVDYNALQQKGGYKTAASATACYLAARKKMLAVGKEVGGGAESTAGSGSGVEGEPGKAATAGTKRKVGKKAKGEEEEVLAKRVKREGVKEVVEDEDDDEEGADEEMYAKNADSGVGKKHEVEKKEEEEGTDADMLGGSHLLNSAEGYLLEQDEDDI